MSILEKDYVIIGEIIKIISQDIYFIAFLNLNTKMKENSVSSERVIATF